MIFSLDVCFIYLLYWSKYWFTQLFNLGCANIFNPSQPICVYPKSGPVIKWLSLVTVYHICFALIIFTETNKLLFAFDFPPFCQSQACIVYYSRMVLWPTGAAIHVIWAKMDRYLIFWNHYASVQIIAVKLFKQILIIFLKVW